MKNNILKYFILSLIPYSIENLFKNITHYEVKALHPNYELKHVLQGRIFIEATDNGEMGPYNETYFNTKI